VWKRDGHGNKCNQVIRKEARTCKVLKGRSGGVSREKVKEGPCKRLHLISCNPIRLTARRIRSTGVSSLGRSKRETRKGKPTLPKQCCSNNIIQCWKRKQEREKSSLTRETNVEDQTLYKRTLFPRDRALKCTEEPETKLGEKNRKKRGETSGKEGKLTWAAEG